jgi:hypothetical protein
MVTPESQETVVKHCCFWARKKTKKATDYTPTTVTISGIGKGVYIIDNYPDIVGMAL